MRFFLKTSSLSTKKKVRKWGVAIRGYKPDLDTIFIRSETKITFILDYTNLFLVLENSEMEMFKMFLAERNKNSQKYLSSL
jgi:hypothetical protein